MSSADLSRLEMPSDFQQNRVTADLVADKLRTAIRTGALPDGAALSQAAIAERFGISRQPVREAMRQLMAEGLVESRAHHGAVVRALSVERLAEIYDNRALLEGHMLMRAIPHIPAGAIEQLRVQDAAMASVTDLDTWLARSSSFHDGLLRFAGDETAMELVAQLRARAERYVHMWTGIGSLRQNDLAAGEHAAVLHAIEVGDGPGARSLLEAHIRDTGRRLVELGRAYAAGRK
ncbi:GntR family transcriptional regulator [Streptomyces sp. 6N223]|uniref:GntR family transcriptional regulator n=1 Tax=Streptomyces sp. 6N223 TaxID=3457412 RepID=UPI003FD06FF1